MGFSGAMFGMTTWLFKHCITCWSLRNRFVETGWRIQNASFITRLSQKKSNKHPVPAIARRFKRLGSCDMQRIRSEPNVLDRIAAFDRPRQHNGQTSSSQEEQGERQRVPGSARSDNPQVRP